MSNRQDNLRNRNVVTLESRRDRAAMKFRQGLSRMQVVASLRAKYGVGLGSADLTRLERENKPQGQMTLNLRDPLATLEKIPQDDAVLIIKHMIQKGFHCFILPDGQLELRWG
jgi:hypothetical protein